MDHSFNIDTYPMKPRDRQRMEGVQMIVQLLRTNPLLVVEPVPETHQISHTARTQS